MLAVFLVACAQPSADADSGAAEPVYIPEHSECLPAGEEMPADSCVALVEEDGRYPGVSENKSGTAADPDDPRLSDPDYLWLASEIRRCACVCCHTSRYDGPGTYFWDMDHAPVWIDSASRWSLSVLGGWSEEPDQTLPSDDLERVRAVIEAEIARRDAARD